MSGAMRTHELLAAFCVLLALGTGGAAAQSNCATMRKINIGVSVSPPNVVHTSPYVAKELGLFAKHCIDANIIQFDGGESPAAPAARWRRAPPWSRSTTSRSATASRCKQIWGLAPRRRRTMWSPKASRPRPTSRASG